MQHWKHCNLVLYLSESDAQDCVSSPLEHPNSARMDEFISTPITREGRKHAFLVRITPGIPFLSEEMVPWVTFALR